MRRNNQWFYQKITLQFFFSFFEQSITNAFYNSFKWIGKWICLISFSGRFRFLKKFSKFSLFNFILIQPMPLSFLVTESADDNHQCYFCCKCHQHSTILLLEKCKWRIDLPSSLLIYLIELDFSIILFK